MLNRTLDDDVVVAVGQHRKFLLRMDTLVPKRFLPLHDLIQGGFIYFFMKKYENVSNKIRFRPQFRCRNPTSAKNLTQYKIENIHS